MSDGSAQYVLAAIAAAYLSLGIITFAVYAWDKAAARRGAWRVPEATLHVLAVLGGWPGALAAQRALRHKTRKQLFRTVFWITVALNCAALALGLVLITGSAS
ncbi:MAG: DUF1294 domain-containing protein [Coriobacteriia bacterium]|nr:DUF1294 domain-containing protein [Coriobacteriia bacterium]